MMDVEDTKRLKALEKKNAELKKMYADAMLGIKVIKQALEKSSKRGAPPSTGYAERGEGGDLGLAHEVQTSQTTSQPRHDVARGVRLWTRFRKRANDSICSLRAAVSGLRSEAD